MSGVVISCNTTRPPIGFPLQVGSMIDTFVGFVLSVLSELILISNELAVTYYPESLRTNCAQSKFSVTGEFS